MERPPDPVKPAWILSFLIHALVAILMILTNVRGSLPEPEFVEMAWDGNAAALPPLPANSSSDESAVTSSENQTSSAASVTLPGRRSNAPDEILSIPKKEKIAADIPVDKPRSQKKKSDEERENIRYRNSEQEKRTERASATGRGNAAAPFAGDEKDRSGTSHISFAIQWKGGGKRELVSGEMPSFPKGVKVQAQIKLRILVLPSGTVKSVQPVQKAETRLENSAIRQVRLWKFEPLQSAQSQVEQECRVTFNFRLK